MCDICLKSKESREYNAIISKMIERDVEIIEQTKKVSEEMPILKELIYTSVKWPLKLNYPLFEPRNAFAAPNNYFQPLFLNGGKASMFFSHGSTRSVFFSGKRLMLYSKNVNYKEGKDYFTSFVFVHFDKEEYSASCADGEITISVKTEKKLKNLLTGETENKRISFNFLQKHITNRLITKEQAATSTHLRKIYNNYCSIRQKLASSDMEGYVITVPHFSPHPYMLQLSRDFGYADNREFQEKGVFEYFRQHINF